MQTEQHVVKREKLILKLGKSTVIKPEIEEGYLISLGEVQVGGTALRSRSTRFLPYFDTFEGEVFRKFKYLNIEERGNTRIIRTLAISDPDTLFRERRDSSGDPCFRNESWDGRVYEIPFSICFEAAEDQIDGRTLAGFRYWFEYEGELLIHRIIDRQTWEVGGSLEDVTLCLRNWLTPPSLKIGKDTVYSTVGMNEWAGLLPGNLWGRWSLLPGFDLQYGAKGIIVGRFDQVSLIRTVVESNQGEDSIRYLDMHLFKQSNKVKTSGKTILYSDDNIDEVDALNLWTRLQDWDHNSSCAQFNIPREDPPGIVFSENVWRNIHFDKTYEHVIDIAAEFHGDYVFIDVVFEHGQSLGEDLDRLVPEKMREGTTLAKFNKATRNMCQILDWKVNSAWGGEEKLRELCQRAKGKGVKLLSWMSTHSSPMSYLNNAGDPEVKALGGGAAGIFAGKESGRHPDTGYPGECWTYNLNTPVLKWLGDRLVGVCERTGLAGYLWDSFSNLGWWQLDYSQGDMNPQYQRMAELYASLVRGGLYIQPEALVAFSNHSSCGLHGGNIYQGNLLGFSYNTCIALWFNTPGNDDHGSNFENQIIRGLEPVDVLFQCLAHKRIPSLNFHRVPRSEWNAESVIAIKKVLKIYKDQRHRMVRRTVLKDGLGVRWDGADLSLLFAFRDGSAGADTREVISGESVTTVIANNVYFVTGL